MVRFHRENGALVTVGLKRVPNPLEFGIVIVDDEGRVQRFLEKPTWGQVFSDTVNTGIYVMEPEVLDDVAAGESVDWSGDVFPQLLRGRRRSTATSPTATGRTSAPTRATSGPRPTCSPARSTSTSTRFEVSPRRLGGRGRRRSTRTPMLKGPLYIGDYAKVEAGAELREYTVLGSNVVVKSGAFLHRAVVHDNVFIGPQANLRGCVIGKNTDVMRGARIEEGAVIGDECVIEEEAYRLRRRQGLPVQDRSRPARSSTPASSGSRAASATCSARAASSGLVNVEITPELARTAGQRLRHHPEEGRHGHHVARRLPRRPGAQARRHQRAERQRDQRASTWRSCRAAGRPLRDRAGRAPSAASCMRTTPGRPAERRHRLPGRARRRPVPGRPSASWSGSSRRQEFRRAFPGEIAELSLPARVVEAYTHELLRCVDMHRGPRGRPQGRGRLRAAAPPRWCCPACSAGSGVEVLTVNNRLDEASPTETLAERRRDLQRLGRAGGVLAGRRSACGSTRWASGSRWSTRRAQLISDERALLVVLDLVAAERRGGRVALPVTTTRVAEQVCRVPRRRRSSGPPPRRTRSPRPPPRPA